VGDKTCVICKERSAEVDRSACFRCHKNLLENGVRPAVTKESTPAEASLINDARRICTSTAMTPKGLAQIEQMILDAYEALAHMGEKHEPAPEPKGLYGKYRVFKYPSGEEVSDCFVLRPVKDKAARMALGTYAVSGIAPELCEDLVAWIKKLEKENPLP